MTSRRLTGASTPARLRDDSLHSQATWEKRPPGAQDELERHGAHRRATGGATMYACDAAPAQKRRTRPRRRRQARRGGPHAMRLELTDEELATAATACRAMAYQEEQAAKRTENPSTCGPIERTAKWFAAMAQKGNPCSLAQDSTNQGG